MNRDKDIYQNISKILIENTPIHAKIIIMKADLATENDVCKFEFDYVDEKNISHDYSAGGKASLKILNLLVELRQFFKSQNQPYWEGCEFQVDLETGKFEVKFIYEE
jgi:hypothetical protein